MHAYYQAEPKMLDYALSSLEIKYDDGLVIKWGLHAWLVITILFLVAMQTGLCLPCNQRRQSSDIYDGFDMHVLFVNMII
jgi:hypothetical protein